MSRGCAPGAEGLRVTEFDRVDDDDTALGEGLPAADRISTGLSDAELTKRILAGAPTAYPASQELRQRHLRAVLSYAGLCGQDRPAANQLAAQALALASQETCRGIAPQGVWRHHLLLLVQRVAGNWATGHRRGLLDPELVSWLDDNAAAAPGHPDPADIRMWRGPDSAVLGGFYRLPERMRGIVWYSLVDEEPDTETALFLGTSPDVVAGLKERASEAVRHASLRTCLERGDDARCQGFRRIMEAAARPGDGRHSEDLDQHLAECPGCTQALGELMRMVRHPRITLADGLLGWGGPAYVMAESEPVRQNADGPVEPAAPAGLNGPTGRSEPYGGPAEPTEPYGPHGSHALSGPNVPVEPGGWNAPPGQSGPFGTPATGAAPPAVPTSTAFSSASAARAARAAAWQASLQRSRLHRGRRRQMKKLGKPVVLGAAGTAAAAIVAALLLTGAGSGDGDPSGSAASAVPAPPVETITTPEAPTPSASRSVGSEPPKAPPRTPAPTRTSKPPAADPAPSPKPPPPALQYGFTQVVNAHSNLCLDVEGGEFEKRTDVVMARCDGTGTQLWQLDDQGLVHSYADRDFCLDSRGDTDRGVGIWPCSSAGGDSGANLRFIIDGVGTIRPYIAPDFALTPEVPASGSMLDLRPADDESDQRWAASPSSAA